MKKKKTGKYKNIIVKTKDGKFDSKKEHSVWLKLKRQEGMGLIQDLKRQVPFVLIEKSKWGRERKYIADFVYTDCETGELVVADCKSDSTENDAVFSLKARLFAEIYGKEIKIIK